MRSFTKNPNSLSVISVVPIEKTPILDDRRAPVPKFNRKLERSLRTIFEEQRNGFEGLLRYDNFRYIDRLMFESPEG